MTSSLVKLASYLLLTHILISSGQGKGTPPLPGSIIDGQFADKDEFKYIVAIRQEGFFYHGAGSIIHPEWIFTARHVVVDQYDDPTSFYFNFSKISPLYVYPKYHINLLHFHEKVFYQVKNLFCLPIPDDVDVYPADNDIALIQLEYPIPLEVGDQYGFEKIDLNSEYIDFNRGETKLVAAGWGITSPPRLGGNQMDMELRKAQNESHPPSGNKDLEFRPYQQFNMHNQKHGICSGDSGGPVITRDKHGKDLLVGVISNGPQTCDDASTQMNVQFYKKWIDGVVEEGDTEENLRKYSCNNLYGREYNNP